MDLQPRASEREGKSRLINGRSRVTDKVIGRRNVPNCARERILIKFQRSPGPVQRVSFPREMRKRYVASVIYRRQGNEDVFGGTGRTEECRAFGVDYLWRELDFNWAWNRLFAM